MEDNPIAYFENGEVHVRQFDGSYKPDYLGSWAWGLWLTLHQRPDELRTQQDRDNLKVLTDVFRARREWEEKKVEALSDDHCWS